MSAAAKASAWLVNVNLAAGGAERHLINLATHWDSHALRAKLILLERSGALADQVPTCLDVVDIGLKRPRGLVAQGMWGRRCMRGLRRLLVHDCPDVALTFLWLPTLLLSLAGLGLPTKPRLVWSVQSDLTRRYDHQWTGRVLLRLLRAMVMPRVRRFVAPSRGIQRQLIQQFSIDPSRITVVPNAVDIRRARAMATMGGSTVAPRSCLRFVSVGRLVPEKGYVGLVRAFARAFPREGAELIIVGAGPERDKIAAAALAEGVGDRVVLPGFAANPYAWLSSADAFVSSSLWETFGVAIVEALAVGLPVIATATDGALDIVEPGRNGLLVPVGDVEALAQGLVTLAEAVDLRRAFAGSAAITAATFAASEVAQRYLEVLETVRTQ